MKNKLLLTTALVSVAFAASVASADSGSADRKALEGEISKVEKQSVVESGKEAHASGLDVTVKDMKKENDSGTGTTKTYGALRNGGDLTIEDSTFEDNKLENSSSNENYGGAIAATSGSNTVIKGGEFSGNSVKHGHGGAIWTSMEKDGRKGGKLTISGGTLFEDNTAEWGGGAIWSSGETDISDATFRYNHVTESLNDGTGPDGGGAIFVGPKSQISIKDSVFEYNTSTGDGGAIGTRLPKDAQSLDHTDLSKAGLTVENSRFTGNEGRWGGAISNAFYQDHEGHEGVRLSGNTYEDNKAIWGGAIAGDAGSNTIVSGGSFTHNTTTALTDGQGGQGGAIWVGLGVDDFAAGKLTVENARFENNEADIGGGAIWTAGKTKITGATFKGNKSYGTTGTADTDTSKTDNKYNAEGGGAIFVNAEADVTIQDSWFEGNLAGTVGGAIATRGQDNGTNTSKLTIDNSHFIKNQAVTGGAINIGSSNQKDVKITNSEFTENTSKHGGAIYNKGVLTISDSSFNKNEAHRQENEKDPAGVGGAILNSGGTMTITDTDFDGNTAIQGGAIYGSKGDSGGTVSIKGGRFTNNKATGSYGGAIASDQYTTLSLEDVTFEDNYAALDGGAISLTKEATFKGNNVFKNNYVGENKKNDLAIGSGKVTLAEGASLSLDGGISGKGGTLNVGNGSILNVKDTTTVESNVSGLGSVQVVVTDKTMDDSHTLKLVGKDGIFNNKGLTPGTASSTGVSTSYVEMMFDKDANNLYTFEENKSSKGWGIKDATYTVKERSTGDIANRLGVKEAEAATLLATSSSESDSGNEAFDDIQDTLRSAAQYGHDSDSLSRAADALVADAAPVVQTRETMLSNMIFDAANDALDDNASALVVGQASGDSLVDKAKVWIKGLFNSADKDETNKAHGFDIDTYGVAMGADKEIGAGKVGLGYAYNQSDINGYTRDTDVDTHSVFLYGQYKPADWYVKGVAAYSWSDYEEKKSVLNHDAKAKYDVDTLALQGLYGYDFHVGDGYDVTPEGGLRYLHASQDSYTNALGVRVKDRDIDVWTAVAGVKVAKDFAVSDSVTIRPELRAALTYDLSTDDNESSVVLTNGQAIRVDGEELERFGYELGAKLATDITSDWEVSAGYEGRFRKDYNDHSGIISAKYKF